MNPTTTAPPSQWLCFRLANQRFAMALAHVARVVRAVEVTTLPSAPDLVAGVINVQGEVVPVVQLRRRFHLPERPVTPDNQFVIAQCGRRRMALVVDEVEDLLETNNAAPVPAGDIAPNLRGLKGILPRPDGVILISDPEQLLSLEDEQQLAAALD